MASTIQVRVEDDLKRESDSLFKELGTDTTTAIRMFLKQAVANNGFPFEIKKRDVSSNPYIPMTEEELYTRLEHSRQNAAQGKVRDAQVVVDELRGRYGL